MPQPLALLLELSPSEAARQLRATAEAAWLKRFRDHLNTAETPSDLRLIMSTWDLNASGMAKLFGVSRQALSKWQRAGIPSDRRVAIADLAAASMILKRHIRPERIPAVVRRPAAKLGGLSLMDLAAQGQTDKVLTACREMFAFGRAHS